MRSYYRDKMSVSTHNKESILLAILIFSPVANSPMLGDALRDLLDPKFTGGTRKRVRQWGLVEIPMGWCYFVCRKAFRGKVLVRIQAPLSEEKYKAVKRQCGNLRVLPKTFGRLGSPAEIGPRYLGHPGVSLQGLRRRVLHRLHGQGCRLGRPPPMPQLFQAQRLVGCNPSMESGADL